MVACVFLLLASAAAVASAQGSSEGSYGDGGLDDDGVYGTEGVDVSTPRPVHESMNGGGADDGIFLGSLGDAGDSCDCVAVVEYVCGSDGNTYMNACMAICAGVVPVFQGVCYNGCMCFSEFYPFCLVPEQTTFQNDCLFNCKVKGLAGLDAFVVPGKCTGACSDCSTTMSTVCEAATGNEYPNSCYAECSGVVDWQQGSCDEVFGIPCEFPVDYSGEYDPDEEACGSDGVTYENVSAAYCNDTRVAYPGPCATDCGSCADQGGPEVCGVDGITYMNVCAARCAPIAVDAAVEGPCGEDGCGCSAEVLEPVCATSSNTYMNRCFAECNAEVLAGEGPCEYNSDYVEPMDGYGNPIEVVNGTVVVIE